MNLNKATLQYCIDTYEIEGREVTINDGIIIKFGKNKKDLFKTSLKNLINRIVRDEQILKKCQEDEKRLKNRIHENLRTVFYLIFENTEIMEFLDNFYVVDESVKNNLVSIGALYIDKDEIHANEPGIYPKKEEIPTQTANPSGDE